MASDPILDAFAHQVRRRGNDVLIASPRQRASLEEVSRLADLLAIRIGDSCLPPGSLVGLTAPNGSALLAGYLGLRRAGHPVLLVDWPTPRSELDRIHHCLHVAVTLIGRERFPNSQEDFELHSGPQNEDRAQFPEEVSTVRLSSGSTGAPQGIAHTSEALLADDEALRASMSLGTERALAALPMTHAYGFSSLLLPALTAGWTLVVPQEGNPLAPITAATTGEVTFFPTAPAFLNALVKMISPPPLPASVRLVISAGAHLTPATASRFREAFGLRVHTFYGASEVGGITFDRQGDAAERGTVGSPIDGVNIRLIAQEGLESYRGLIQVESLAAATGYFPKSNPRLGRGRFTTSDLGRFDGSELVLLGRLDDFVNVRGKKVNPREVAKVLEEMPEVTEAVIHPVPAANSSEQILAALVVANSEQLRVSEVLTWCRGCMAAHKVPRRVRIVTEIPRSPRGKVDWRAVKASLEAPITKS